MTMGNVKESVGSVHWENRKRQRRSCRPPRELGELRDIFIYAVVNILQFTVRRYVFEILRIRNVRSGEMNQ